MTVMYFRMLDMVKMIGWLGRTLNIATQDAL